MIQQLMPWGHRERPFNCQSLHSWPHKLVRYARSINMGNRDSFFYLTEQDIWEYFQ